jgi:hypothetical protein
MSFSSRWWLVIPLAAALFIVGVDCGRVRHVTRLRDFERGAGAGAYVAGRHWLVSPGHHSRTYQWLMETEQMLSTGGWRVRSIGHENAPAGREVHSASPYRWWLGLIAWADHTLTGRPIASSVEQAALWAGPLVHLLALTAGTLMILRRFGPKSAAVFSAGVAGLYPLAGEFLPGVADDRGLAILCAAGCVLGLVAGLNGDRKWFMISGVAGGLGLWVSAATQMPVLAAVGGGALVLAAGSRLSGAKDNGVAPPPWNLWALTGAGTALMGYFVEYYPDHLGLRLEVNHPLHGLTWIGLGALLTLTELACSGQAGRDRRTLLTATVAIIGLAAAPLVLALADNAVYLAAQPDAARLTFLPGGPVAPNLATWLNGGGTILGTAAALLPFALLVPVAIALLTRGTPVSARRAAPFVGGGLVVCFALACMQLQWWTITQLMLLTLLVATAPLLRGRAMLLAAALLVPGLIELARPAARADAPLGTREAEGLVERDLAHWIAARTESGTGVVLAPPERTPGLVFHGGMRGLATANWENPEGLAFALRVMGATTADEAQTLLDQRGVTHLVLPSWDTEFDEILRRSMGNPADGFHAALRRWALPPWLEPLAYRLPEMPGFEDRSVMVFRVTDNTDRALALSRLAEYALETQNAEMAASLNETLKTYPAHLSALIGRALIEKARGNAAALDVIVTAIRQGLASRLDRLLPWDRRVSLTVVLAQANHAELAKPQLQRCFAELSDARIRSLSESALYRLLVLSKAYDLPVPQPGLRERMLALLPMEARTKL